MKMADNVLRLKESRTVPYYEDSSFTLVSTLLTEALGRNCQQILVSANAGNFLHDHATGVESTETTQFIIKKSNVIEREEVTEIVIDGTTQKRNDSGNNFSIFFTMKRQFLVIPSPYNALKNTKDRGNKIPRELTISGMLYNSIFNLELKCVDNKRCQYPLGLGRGYLIFEETQKM